MSFDACVHALSNDDICILPTETVYGLACSALSVRAIKKVYELKGRPSSNPLIVHVLNHHSASDISYTNILSQKLANNFWPGPLTLILPKKKCIPSEITAGLNSVAVRSPSHPVFRKVLKHVNLPLAAPSANPSNMLSHTNCPNAVSAFGRNCPPFIDGGQCNIGIESTVLDLTSSCPNILRLGPITKDAIENVIGTKIETQNSGKNQLVQTSLQKSPGQNERHYSPRTNLHLYSTLKQMLNSNNLQKGDILLLPHANLNLITTHSKFTLFYLSSTGDPHEITRNLFNILNDADELKKERIHISLFPSNDGLLSAVNDRLSRAATFKF